MNSPERAVPGGRAAADWRRPRTETPGLQRYFQIVRERLRMIVAAVVVTTLAAALYLVLAEPTYKAEADLLITPVASDDPVTEGLPLITESNDPIRDVETAARLATTRDVAARVKRNLELSEDPSTIQGQVSAEPVASSNIVAITGEAGTAKEAADLANGFAEAAVEQRDADLRRELDERIPRLQQRVDEAAGSATEVAALQDELAQLENLRAGGDPTMRVQTLAEQPDSPASPKPKLTIAAGIFAGLLLGVGGAFAMHAIDPRLRREEQLRERFSLPVLARIPLERKAKTETTGPRRFGVGPTEKRRRALSPLDLSPMTLEGYRTLRAMLAATSAPARRGHGRSVLVTGPSPSEGKTTTAINLASSLALAGNQVILVEADFRRPTVGNALNVQPHAGIGKVLLGDVALEDALISTKSFGDNLRVLLVDRVDVWLAEVLSLPTATVLLEEAERLADYVVIDAPPLTEVIDALPIAKQVDDVVLVVRPGSSNLAQLNHLGDLLAQNGITPNGFVLVGVGSSDQDSYYFGNRRDRDMSDWFVPGSTTPAVTETRDGERGTRRRERGRPPERDRGRAEREQPRDQARERDQGRERDQAAEREEPRERDQGRERERDRVQRAN